MEAGNLQQHVQELEEELAELRSLAAAAKEAYAFLSGRRPGFAPSYAYDVLRAACDPDKPRKRRAVKKQNATTRRTNGG